MALFWGFVTTRTHEFGSIAPMSVRLGKWLHDFKELTILSLTTGRETDGSGIAHAGLDLFFSLTAFAAIDVGWHKFPPLSIVLSSLRDENLSHPIFRPGCDHDLLSYKF
jgi:hypothetical protein